MFKYENDMVRKLKTSRRKFVVGSLAAGSTFISTRKAISQILMTKLSQKCNLGIVNLVMG